MKLLCTDIAFAFHGMFDKAVSLIWSRECQFPQRNNESIEIINRVSDSSQIRREDNGQKYGKRF